MAEAPETLTLDDLKGVEVESAENKNTELEGIKEEVLLHTPLIEVVDPYPRNEYPIGLAADMRINVRCPDGCDLGGGTILIGDEKDTVIAEQRLTNLEDGEGENTTGTFSVQIPREPGTYTWTIVYYPVEKTTKDTGDSADSENAFAETTSESGTIKDTDQAAAAFEENAPEVASITYEETPDISEETGTALHAVVQADFVFKAVKHITGMSVWRDSRAPVPIGDDYILNIGVACVSACSLLGQKVSVSYNGAVLAVADVDTAKVYSPNAVAYVPITEVEEPTTPRDPRDIFYCAQVPLTAPNEVGGFRLECHVEPEGLGLAHTSNTYDYVLTTNKHAQCRLDITTMSDGTELGGPVDQPAKYADLIVCPKDGYASYLRTDENGKASIGVPWGEISIEANEDDHKRTLAEITIPEGQEVYEHTMNMPYWPSLMN